MKAIRILFAAAFPLAAFANVPPRPPISSSGQVDSARQREQAEKDYWRGIQLVQGDGVAKNYSAAAQLYRKAAEAGYARAQYQLAGLYEEGLGVECDFKQAAAWYRKAAEQGDPEAQNNLGALYATGRGVARNDGEAVRWYRSAAEQKDPEATSNLGMMYLKGRGVEPDLKQAFQLFCGAAEQGYAAAQKNLALMYANGQGVERDFVWAYAWLDLASGKVSGATELQDQVGEQMTADEIAHAHDLARRKAAEIEQKANQVN